MEFQKNWLGLHRPKSIQIDQKLGYIASKEAAISSKVQLDASKLITAKIFDIFRH